MLGAINLRISQLGHNTARDSLSTGNFIQIMKERFPERFPGKNLSQTITFLGS
jgi:hypothetical protein